MNLRSVFAAAAVLVTVTPVMARTETGSFLNRSAWTQESLVQQLEKDEKVMSRFRRHFGWTREQVLNFAAELTPGYLEKGGTYLVYNSNELEQITAKKLYYKKGTRVWLNADGEPVLKMSCANPMISAKAGSVVIKPFVRGSLVDPRGIEAELKPSVILEEAPVVPTTVESSPSALLAVTPMVPEHPPIIPVVNGEDDGGISYFEWLIPLVFISGGGGSLPPVEDPPPPVPEPATMIGVGVGLSAMAAMRRRRKQKSLD